MHLKFRIRFLITVLLLLTILFLITWRFSGFPNQYISRVSLFEVEFGNLKPTLIKTKGYECHSHDIEVFQPQMSTYHKDDHQLKSCVDCKNSVVVFTFSKSSPTNRYLAYILKVLLIPYHVITINHVQANSISAFLKVLSHTERITMIIFENFAIYTNLPQGERSQVDIFCRKHNVGVIGFLFDGETFTTEAGTWSKVGELPLYIHRLEKPPQGLYTSKSSPLFRITRPNRMNPDILDIQEQIYGTQNITRTQHVCCMATLVPVSNNVQSYRTVAFTKTGEYFGPMSTYDSLPVNMKSCENSSTVSDNSTHSIFQSLVLEDVGLFDGIRRVLFAFRPGGIWISSLLLLDTIVYLSNGSFHASPPSSYPFTSKFEEIVSKMNQSTSPNEIDLLRWVLVDVDDVFVPNRHVYLTIDDINAMIKAQNYWRTFIPRFTFNMGFCGAFFSKSRWSDKIVYNHLLENRHKFWWFDHLWHHRRPHIMNKTCIQQDIERNRQFAKDHDIPVQAGYSISPRHSGVYPVYPDLYDAWRAVSNVNVTSTIHYPYVRPSDFRLGFRYKNIQVLPRQTCGIYAHTLHPEDIQGGMEELNEYILGGALFRTFLFNPVSIFMTHLVNYGNDRLALYVFNTVFEFISNWTNIKLVTSSPLELAEIYIERFKLYGVSELPLYSDPCRNVHLYELWPSHWPCGSNHLPNFIIIGPQKTGSTALLQFLLLHPELIANRFQHNSTFEELQFFSSDDIYSRGVHWYMNQFSNASMLPLSDVQRNERIVNDTYSTDEDVPFMRFEKSATYFDSPKSPARIHALMPKIKLIVLLRNPVDRAYSWYQHRLAHRDIAPQLLSFNDLMLYGHNLTETDLLTIVSAEKLKKFSIDIRDSDMLKSIVSSIHHLWSRCTGPGNYEQHLLNWLNYFPASQILLLDADKFSQNPVPAMEIVQQFLSLRRQLDYSQYLHFNSKKGFYCTSPRMVQGQQQQRQQHRYHDSCLGQSKGRVYERLDREVLIPKLMNLHFSKANHKLYQLLQKQPVWYRMLSMNSKSLPVWIM